MGRTVFEGGRAYFPSVKPIRYEGPGSDNPLAFRVYNADRVVAGKTMKEHLRFAVATGTPSAARGGDPFGPGTRVRPWERRHRPVEMRPSASTSPSSSSRSSACRSTASTTATSRPRARRVAESERQPRHGRRAARRSEQQQTGIKLLWGTANLFSNPRFMHGAAHEAATPTSSPTPRPR